MRYHVLRSAIGVIAGTIIAAVLMLVCSVHPHTIQWVTYLLAPLLTALVAIDTKRLSRSFYGESLPEESSTDESSSEGNALSQSEAAPQQTTLQTLNQTLEKMCNQRNFYRVVKGAVGLSVLALIAVLLLYVFVDPNADRLLARSAIVGSPLAAVGVYLLARPRVDQIVAA